MDLHDFKDVAENYDRYLDVMYAHENSMHENFQEFYLELAKKYGSGGWCGSALSGRARNHC